MNRATGILTAIALLALPAVAVAAGGAAGHADGGTDWAGVFRHALNLAALLFIMRWALKTPLGDFLKFRRSEIKEQLEASEIAKAEAEAKFAQLQDRLAGFEAELVELVAQVKAEAAAERTRLLEQAQRSAAQIEEAGRRTAEEELRRARATLRADAIDVAVSMATDVLTREVGAADQKRLNDQYMDKLQEVAS